MKVSKTPEQKLSQRLNKGAPKKSPASSRGDLKPRTGSADLLPPPTRKKSPLPPGESSGIVDFMVEQNIPLTRKNYLRLATFNENYNPTPEEEQMLPSIFRIMARNDWPDDEPEFTYAKNDQHGLKPE